MPQDLLAILVIFSVSVIVAVADGLIKRRAERRDLHSECVKCGRRLKPFQAESIAVAGGIHVPTSGRACPRCFRRDQMIRRITWGILALSFSIMIYLAWRT